MTIEDDIDEVANGLGCTPYRSHRAGRSPPEGAAMTTLRDLLAGRPWRRRTSTARPDGAVQSIVWRANARWIGDHWWAGAWSEDWIGCDSGSLLVKRGMR